MPIGNEILGKGCYLAMIFKLSTYLGDHCHNSLYLYREKWDALLKVVKADIISMMKDEEMDAYVLRYS